MNIGPTGQIIEEHEARISYLALSLLPESTFAYGARMPAQCFSMPSRFGVFPSSPRVRARVASGVLLLLSSGGCFEPTNASTGGDTSSDSGPMVGESVGSDGTNSGGGPSEGAAPDPGGTDGSGGANVTDGTGGLETAGASTSGGSVLEGSEDSNEETGSGGTSAGSGSGDVVGGESGGTDSGGDDGALSPGCGTAFSTPPPSNQQQTLEIAGDTRYYLLDVPDGADNQTPLMLVFALHGFDMNNIAVVDLFNFTERSGGTAITVWPQGEGPHPGDVPHWGDQVLQSTWSANEANYAFLQQIMTDLGQRYCIDTTRIFITGFSMGGFFTNSIACAHGDWFRAFAPVAGGGPQGCENESPVAIMVQHGTQDDIVEISSGEGSRDHWLDVNGCDQTSMKSLNNCDFYAGCPDDHPVAWCTGSYDHYIPNEVASNIWSFFSGF